MNPSTNPPPLVPLSSTPAAQHLASAVDTSHVTLPATRIAVDARGLALGVLAALSLIFALSWAEKFLVPLLLGVVIAYTLNPLVVWLEAIKIPRVAGTIIVMAGVIGALVLGNYLLRGGGQTIIEQLPEASGQGHPPDRARAHRAARPHAKIQKT